MSEELSEKEKVSIDKHYNARVKQLYFSPKFRKAEKRLLLRTLRHMKTLWPSRASLPETERDVINSLTAFSSTMLGIVSEAEKWNAGRKLRNKKYILWKHTFRNEYLVSFMFFKVSEGIHKQGSVIFPAGLPAPGLPVIAYLYRHAFATGEYREIERGTFYQKYIDIGTVVYSLKNTARTIRFSLIDEKHKPDELMAYAIS
jgi:hypothetical protein